MKILKVSVPWRSRAGRAKGPLDLLRRPKILVFSLGSLGEWVWCPACRSDVLMSLSLLSSIALGWELLWRAASPRV